MMSMLQVYCTLYIFTLTHETWNDSMKNGILVSKASFSSTKLFKIRHRFGHNATIQAHFNATFKRRKQQRYVGINKWYACQGQDDDMR
jgi:hypothetical protein